MIIDRQWAQRNLGFDPIARPALTSPQLLGHRSSSFTPTR